ncbi:ead/Ea22-like family protein [Escherichia coli]|uniref:ead/Ea22-like family protein n=1 Tax=Escherichia coli TaxID=562 RepID=UPI0009DA4C10|nr:ead/Ea22-like family protein [Escherichia coli]EES9402136.1 ead/Ea22-like family protein [Escherichia coli]EEY8868584.1 ead/Ea22-like family protein [Escherichia coli]EFC0866492.1 ead/Ea22-like family protein [Escherichia coli]EGA1175002.1 ead/Ea22-like family protein [Escherichia coli]MBB7847530.1 ead/Ea22-like family protein [Escherichia coli]
MSKIDYQKLREIAEKTKIAGEAPVMPFDQRINALNDFMKHFSPDIALALLDERERNQQYIKSRDQENEDIALTVGKLRVELEAAKKRIAELEKSEEQLINERDHAESALADMYFAATGDRPEWSNWFGFSDAVDAVVDRIADLEAKQCIEEMSKQSCEARERDLFESWVMHSICISKSTLEGLRTETGYRNATLSGTDFNRMWEQWKSIRAAGIRIKGE